MIHLIKKYFIFILLCCMTGSASAQQTIKFALEATYPPFEYMSAGGRIKGFDIDIAKALCKQMNATCTFTSQPFNSLIPSLKLGKFDAIISAIGVTPERLKQVAFTESYYEPSGSYVAPTAKHYSPDQLIGKTIGVQMGTTFERYLQERYGQQVKQKGYASIQEAFLDLVAGRVDAVLADTPIALAWLKEANHASAYSTVGLPLVDPKYFGSGYAIAVRKDNQTLLKSFNQALREIKTNGTYQQIVKQYFAS